jgi:PAS domain-containing protein
MSGALTIEKARKRRCGGEECFRRVFEQSPLGMVTADLDGRLRQANAALSRMLGYSGEELAGLCYLDIVHKFAISTLCIKMIGKNANARAAPPPQERSRTFNWRDVSYGNPVMLFG